MLDHWDLDRAFERQIMDIEVRGQKRRALATVSKGVILDTLDTAGGLLFAADLNPSLKG